MILQTKITPNSSKNEIIGWFGDQLKIKINAAPEKGLANKELIKFLSKLLGISKSQIQIIKGHTSSSKILSIENINLDQLNSILNLSRVQDSLPI